MLRLSLKPIVIIAISIVLLIPINVAYGIESFVDTSKDPQLYIDRYNNEEKYKEWFDTNYPNTTIYDAVGIKEPDLNKIPEWVRNTFVWYAENKISESELIKEEAKDLKEGMDQWGVWDRRYYD